MIAQVGGPYNARMQAERLEATFQTKLLCQRTSKQQISCFTLAIGEPFVIAFSFLVESLATARNQDNSSSATYFEVVIVETEWVQPMTITAYDNNSRTLRRQNLFHYQVRE